MGFDNWHIERYLRVRGYDQPLPFGAPPVVLGEVVTAPEPVWRALVATATAHGAPPVFADWDFDHPLSAAHAAELGPALGRVRDAVVESGRFAQPEDLDETKPVPAKDVLLLLGAVYDLLAFAVRREAAIETWTD
ncbi:hypothetical protein [Actinokineospora diospyrosa]|uniref:Uncharacterized protein n=1 Tax=Actinokineospora diospyrosa TaxID=103728 RepID=A0ABT1IG03_9PSEU|nr:hypothetical protein [Actinokineospora diospyrosa]MCP2271503.1 hypothetical protein [Actinokineospora diospyrosa]